MAIELKVPPVGESITEVVIGEWLKSEGDSVQRDEVLVKLETDKVTVDLPAPSAGRLGSIKVKQGQTAAVGDVIGYFEEGASSGAAPKPAAAPAAAAASSAPAPASAQVPAAESSRGRELRDNHPPQGFARVMRPRAAR
jgi:2-oxoglutarate dehydrogenase E2 component (dihydrolipoamide succinyltransferase)